MTTIGHDSCRRTGLAYVPPVNQRTYDYRIVYKAGSLYLLPFRVSIPKYVESQQIGQVFDHNPQTAGNHSSFRAYVLFLIPSVLTDPPVAQPSRDSVRSRDRMRAARVGQLLQGDHRRMHGRPSF